VNQRMDHYLESLCQLVGVADLQLASGVVVKQPASARGVQ
jgi:hypothetical protein